MRDGRRPDVRTFSTGLGEASSLRPCFGSGGSYVSRPRRSYKPWDSDQRCRSRACSARSRLIDAPPLGRWR
jgi:hypothetical protein